MPNPNTNWAPHFNLHALNRRTIYTTPEEFENGDFTLKTQEMFYVHTTTEEIKNATITGNFEFVFVESSVREKS